MNKLKELINKAHENAVKRNAYDCEDCKGTGKTPQKNIIAKLWEEIEELEMSFSDNYQRYEYIVQDISNNNEIEAFKLLFEKWIKNTIGDELADIILVCMAASKELNIPIIEHLQAKNKYNSEVHSDN